MTKPNRTDDLALPEDPLDEALDRLFQEHRRIEPLVEQEVFRRSFDAKRRAARPPAIGVLVYLVVAAVGLAGGALWTPWIVAAAAMAILLLRALERRRKEAWVSAMSSQVPAEP